MKTSLLLLSITALSTTIGLSQIQTNASFVGSISLLKPEWYPGPEQWRFEAGDEPLGIPSPGSLSIMHWSGNEGDVNIIPLYSGEQFRWTIFKPNGDVGLGQPNPQARLDVATTNGVRLQLIGNLSPSLIRFDTTEHDNPAIEFHRSTGAIDGTGAFFPWRIFAGYGDFRIQTGPKANEGSAVFDKDVVTFDNLGNVGIGTANPIGHVPNRRALVVAAAPGHDGALVEVWGDMSGKTLLQSRAGRSYVGNLKRGEGPGHTHIIYGEGDIGMTISGIGGNVGIGTETPQAKLDVAGKINCTVLELSSDRNVKEGFESVNTDEILDKVSRLPITTWHFTNSPSIRHIGPVAQDFKTAFNVGEGDKHISVVDGLGVALAAIQGLHQQVQEQTADLQRKDARISTLEAELAAVKHQLAANAVVMDKLIAALEVAGTETVRTETQLQSQEVCNLAIHFPLHSSEGE